MLTGFVLNGLMTFAEQAGSAYTPPSVRTAIARGIEYVTKVTLESNNPVLENDFGATLFKGTMYGRYVRLSQYEGLRVLGRYLDYSVKWE